MSAPFTEPTSDWSKLSVINELVRAVYERTGGAMADPAYPVTDGADVQKRSFWRNMQIYLDSYSLRYLDISQMSGGSFDGVQAAFPYVFPGGSGYHIRYPSYTEATWRAAAGMSPNGWRRTTDGISFEYGLMAEDDAIGPWIVEDLVRGVNALRWCYASSLATDYIRYIGGYGDHASCASTLSANLASWAEHTLGSNPGAPEERIEYHINEFGHYLTTERSGTEHTIQPAIWVYGSKVGLNYRVQGYVVPWTFQTFDDLGTGWTQNNLNLVQSVASPAVGETWRAGWSTVNPASGLSCPIATGSFGYDSNAFSFAECEFSNMSTDVDSDPWE